MRVLFICFVCTIVQNVTAQKNAVFIEALGNGGLVSLNYERQLTKSPKIMLRLGLGMTADDLVERTQLLSVVSSLHYLFNLKKGNYIDVSLGISWFDAAKQGPNNGVYQLLTGVGFRRNFGKNWFFRGHISPYILTLTNSKKLPDSNAGGFGGFSTFYYPSRTRFYRYLHEDAWLGFSIGVRL